MVLVLSQRLYPKLQLSMYVLAATLGPLAHFSCSARPPQLDTWEIRNLGSRPWENNLGKTHNTIQRVSEHFKYYNHIWRVLDLIF